MKTLKYHTSNTNLSVYLFFSIPTPSFAPNLCFAIFFLTLRTSISSARISVTTPAIFGTRSRAAWLKLHCAFRSAGGTRIPNQIKGSRGAEGVQSFAVEAEGSDDSFGEGSEEEECSGDEGVGVGVFVLAAGRRENIGEEEGEGFMHLAEWG